MNRTPLAARVLAAVAALFWVGPYLWMVSTSFKTLPELLKSPLSPLPQTLAGGAYREVWSSLPLGRYLVRDAHGGGWYFAARRPLTRAQRWLRRALMLFAVVCVLYGVLPSR